jgi:uncharacterized protein (DUF1810 family)
MPFDLLRFVEIQENTFEQALAEVRDGKKRNHWMAYIFPMLSELEDSDESEMYGINSKAEAKAYIEHPILGARLREISRALFAFDGKTAEDIFGAHDAKKLISCMTLFAEVSDDKVIFIEVLRKYNRGDKDYRSLYLMQFL